MSTLLVSQWDAWWHWVRDAESPDVFAVADCHPLLAGCRTPADLALKAGTDAGLLALVAAAQDGAQLAGRVVIQVMLPRLISLAARDPRATIEDYLGEAWLVVMGFPLARNRAVLTNLCLDVLKKLSRARARTAREHPTRTPPEPPASPATEPGAAELLDLAGARGLVSRANIEVLRSVYAEGLSGKDAAARHGISHDMVRYRCSSALRHLRARRGELLAA